MSQLYILICLGIWKRLFFLTLSIIIISSCGGDSSDMASDYSYYNQKSGYHYDNHIETQVEVEKYKDYGENIFLPTIENKISTFSVDADGASYANMRRFQYIGQNPPKASVRIEEYINYFTYDYENPTNGDMISLNSEMIGIGVNFIPSKIFALD